MQGRPRALLTPLGNLYGRHLAVGETRILLHPPLPLLGVSIGIERRRQQNDSLAAGYERPAERDRDWAVLPRRCTRPRSGHASTPEQPARLDREPSGPQGKGGALVLKPPTKGSGTHRADSKMRCLTGLGSVGAGCRAVSPPRPPRCARAPATPQPARRPGRRPPRAAGCRRLSSDCPSPPRTVSACGRRAPAPTPRQRRPSAGRCPRESRLEVRNERHCVLATNVSGNTTERQSQPRTPAETQQKGSFSHERQRKHNRKAVSVTNASGNTTERQCLTATSGNTTERQRRTGPELPDDVRGQADLSPQQGRVQHPVLHHVRATSRHHRRLIAGPEGCLVVHPTACAAVPGLRSYAKTLAQAMAQACLPGLAPPRPGPCKPPEAPEAALPGGTQLESRRGEDYTYRQLRAKS